MSHKIRVLFLCIHNSARSQMAEGLLNALGGDKYEAESAGYEPAGLNPLAVQVMQEIDIDISKNKAKDVFDLYKEGRMYTYVVSVCDESDNEKCPIFPGMMMRLSWPFSNPANFTGSHEEKLAQTREVRDAIQKKIESFLSTGFVKT